MNTQERKTNIGLNDKELISRLRSESFTNGDTDIKWHAADAIERRDAVIKRLRTALRKAGEQFRFYQRNHLAKAERLPTMSEAYLDTIKKADTNDHIAKMCEAALSQAGDEEARHRS